MTVVTRRRRSGRGNGLPHQCEHWFAMTGTSGAVCNGRKKKPSCVVIPRSEATWESASLVSLPRYDGRGGNSYRGNRQRQRSGSGKLWWHSPFDRQRYTGKPIARGSTKQIYGRAWRAEEVLKRSFKRRFWVLLSLMTKVPRRRQT